MHKFIRSIILVGISYLIINAPVTTSSPPKAASTPLKLSSLFKKVEAQQEPKKEEPVAAPEPPKIVEEPKVVEVPPPAPAPVVEAPKAPPAPAITGTKTDWMKAAGIPANDWPAVDFIIMREGKWCPTRWNGYHGSCQATPVPNTYGDGGLGVCQATPAIKMAVMGADWETNPITQLKWCDKYAKERYGGWWQAMAAWQRQGWW